MKAFIVFMLLVSPMMLMAQEKSTTDTSHHSIELMPDYPGGAVALLKYITQSVTYPKQAQKHHIEGTVYVQFFINETGNVADAHVVRSVDALLDAEAMRVVNNMPLWKPGSVDGVPVSVKYTLPVRFKL